MLTLLISIFISLSSYLASHRTGGSMGEAIGYGVAGLLVPYFVIGFIVRRKMTKVQDELQGLMQRGQQQMQRKIQQFQTRPGGNIKQIQRILEKDQNAVAGEALEFVDRFEPFRTWSLFMGRQIATLRLQFLYQLKKFDEVDQIFATRGMFKAPMMTEPLMVAMKMARQYKNEDMAGLEKTFRQRLKWFRGSKGVLLYGLMSWAYMKKGEAEKARQLLIKGKEATGDETLGRNLEMLSNNKEKHFSNAGLGEEWYSLYLENPPHVKQQRVRGDARGGRRF